MNDEQLEALLGKVPETGAETTCVDDGELNDYRLGRSTEARATQIELHLAHCRACRELLLGLAQPVSLRAQTRSAAAFEQGRRPRFGRVAALGAVAMALAAGLALFALRPPASKMQDYELIGPFGGIAELRGAESTSSKLALDGTVRFVVRPQAPVAGPVYLRVLRVEDDGRLTDVTGDDWSISEEGAARWSASVRSALGAEPGGYRLAIVVSKEQPKNLNEARLETAQQSNPGAWWWTKELTVVGDSKGSDIR